MTRLFCWYQYFWPSGLDHDFDIFFLKNLNWAQIAWMRWPNVGLWLVGWLMVGVGFVTLGQCRGQRATLHWVNADCQRWPNVATDAGPTLDQRIHLGPWPNVGPMSKITLGQRLFSSPEPKAQVSYCHSAPSVVRPSVVVRKLSHFQLLL